MERPITVATITTVTLIMVVIIVILIETIGDYRLLETVLRVRKHGYEKKINGNAVQRRVALKSASVIRSLETEDTKDLANTDLTRVNLCTGKPCLPIGGRKSANVASDATERRQP